MIIKSLPKDELIKHGVDSSFADVLSNPNEYDEYLHITIGKSDWDYVIPIGVSSVIPLWDVNADSFVRWERNGIIEFVWLFHDSPNYSLIAYSEQGIIAKLYQSLTEYMEEDECRKIGSAMGFKYIDEAESILENEWDSYASWMLNLEKA
jgi:hypothetical protein